MVGATLCEFAWYGHDAASFIERYGIVFILATNYGLSDHDKYGSWEGRRSHKQRWVREFLHLDTVPNRLGWVRNAMAKKTNKARKSHQVHRSKLPFQQLQKFLRHIVCTMETCPQDRRELQEEKENENFEQRKPIHLQKTTTENNVIRP